MTGYSGSLGGYTTAAIATYSATANYRSAMTVELDKLIALIPDIPDTNAERENPRQSAGPFFGMMSPVVAASLRQELAVLRSVLRGSLTG